MHNYIELPVAPSCRTIADFKLEDQHGYPCHLVSARIEAAIDKFVECHGPNGSMGMMRRLTFQHWIRTLSNLKQSLDVYADRVVLIPQRRHKTSVRDVDFD